MAGHSRSHSQEAAELGSKPRVDITHYFECFLSSLISSRPPCPCLWAASPTRIQRRKERKPLQKSVRSGLVSDWSCLSSVPAPVLWPGILCHVSHILGMPCFLLEASPTASCTQSPQVSPHSAPELTGGCGVTGNTGSGRTAPSRC